MPPIAEQVEALLQVGRLCGKLGVPGELETVDLYLNVQPVDHRGYVNYELRAVTVNPAVANCARLSEVRNSLSSIPDLIVDGDTFEWTWAVGELRK